MKRFFTYLKIWKLNASNTLQEFFVNRYTHILFYLGKVIRLGMSLLFLYLIKDQISQFSDYSPDQVKIGRAHV